MAKLKGHYTLQEYADIVAKDRKEIRKLEEELKKSQSEVEKLRQEIDSIQSELTLIATPEAETKKILELYAKANSYSEIFEKMKFVGFRDISMNVIKEVCVNKENLPSDMYNYYLEQEKAYTDNIKINSDVYKDRLMSRYERLYSECEYDLSKNDLTFEEKNKLKAQMSDILNKMNAVLKNIVDDDDNKEDKSITILKETMSEYEDNVSNIVKLTINPNEIKTLDKIN